jgi:succinate dehydrogenase / fumarate reductase flavoprotein subunit
MGVLLSEALRGEGAVFVNDKGERFMERYAPTMKDLASRDVCSRCIYLEVREGRGIKGKDYVFIDATPATINKYKSGPSGKTVTAEHLEHALPDVFEMARIYLGVEPLKEGIPIQPTAHYAMGGIPTDLQTRVLADANGSIVKGLFAAGECACVSVHGANRLGTNSLVDLIVFGRRGGKAMAEFVQQADYAPLPQQPEAYTVAELDHIRASKGKEIPGKIRQEMQKMMMADVGVFREGPTVQKALDAVRELQQRYKHIGVQDTSARFNTDILEAWELGCLLDLAEVTALSALNRTESRGAHWREDFPKRDDVNWMKHTFVTLQDGKQVITYKPVTLTKFEPKERKY